MLKLQGHIFMHFEILFLLQAFLVAKADLGGTYIKVSLDFGAFSCI